MGSRGHTGACGADVALPEADREVEGEKERSAVRAPGGVSSPASQERL